MLVGSVSTPRFTRRENAFSRSALPHNLRKLGSNLGVACFILVGIEMTKPLYKEESLDNTHEGVLPHK